MIKLLIVSSEPLNPDDIYSSTFELSQAQVLARHYAVGVLSVRPAVASGSYLKTAVRKLLASIARGRMRTAVNTCDELIRYLLGRLSPRRSVHVHTIEGITVYEAVAEGLAQTDGTSEYLAAWVRGGHLAFAAYCRDHGVPDVIHAHGRFLSAGALALDIRRAFGVPYVYTEHSSYFQRNLAPLAARPILHDILNAASAYTAVSIAVADQVAKYLQSPSPTAAIVPNVIDQIYESTAPAAAPPSGRFTFVNVASLYPHKGVDVLLHAFAKAFARDGTYQLQICGDGPLRKDLEGLSADLGIAPQVCFLGFQAKHGILDAIDHAHVLVLASHVETFGVVVIEALARGRPVVATRCGATPVIVRDGCGILVPAGDVEQMASALRRIAAAYPAYDGASIRRYALQTYGARAFQRTMQDLYDGVLRHGGQAAVG